MFVDCHTPADLQALPPVFKALTPVEAHSGGNRASQEMRFFTACAIILRTTLYRGRPPLRVSQCCNRYIRTIALGLCVLSWAPELQAHPVVGVLALKTIGNWVLTQVPSYLAGKAIDWATGQDFSQQLEKEIPRLVTLISAATGPRRTALQENLEIHREQLAVLSRLTDAQGKRIAEIQADQERLLQRIESLALRMEALERRVDRLDTRVDELDSRLRQVEDALIRECLDLRYAAVLGADEYRVKETPGGWSTDRFESGELSLDLRLLLNSCSADLTRRGLVIQLSLVTRDLGRDLTLYATWKGVGVNGYTLGPPRLLDRQEFPLARPGYRLDGQVVELFFPYDEISGFGTTDRLALALVLTHDGTVLYTLPDRVISCAFGQRVQCQWGR
jgi:hypothetical protein